MKKILALVLALALVLSCASALAAKVGVSMPTKDLQRWNQDGENMEKLLKNLIDNVPTTMPRWLQIFVIILFAGAGGALLVFAWRVWKKGREDQDENPVDLEDQEDSAKSEENGSEK